MREDRETKATRSEGKAFALAREAAGLLATALCFKEECPEWCGKDAGRRDQWCPGHAFLAAHPELLPKKAGEARKRPIDLDFRHGDEVYKYGEDPSRKGRFCHYPTEGTAIVEWPDGKRSVEIRGLLVKVEHGETA